jgi:SAM-dependent methyltransferase
MNPKRHPWETIYAREGRVFTEPIPGFGAVTQKFTQNKCRRVLDLGCGNGRHVVALVKHGFEVVGLDISPSGLRLTRKWLEDDALDADLVAADVRQPLPFERDSFEGLISTQVIHHALIGEVRLAIAEIWRVLTRGGIAFVTVAGRKHEDLAYEEIEPGTFIPLDGTEKGLPHHIFTEDELRREFEAFQIQQMERRAEGRVIVSWLLKEP